MSCRSSTSASNRQLSRRLSKPDKLLAADGPGIHGIRVIASESKVGDASNNNVMSLLKRIASGDSAAVRECIDQYGGLIWSLARRLSRNPADAEDATQEIFLALWRNAARFDESKGSEKLFIAMLARRRLFDRLRKTRNEPPMDSSSEILESVEWPDPGARSESAIEAEQAKQALTQLRPEHRQVLELGLLHGLTQSEIAARLNMPLGTVKSFMRRGIARVREVMNIEVQCAGRVDV